MDLIEVLQVVKCKLFEPRKKFVYDSLGNKAIESSKYWFQERQSLLPDDIKVLESYEGWNVADKDYVDYKFNELKKDCLNNCFKPSAPPLEPTKTPSSTKSVSHYLQKTVFHSSAQFLDDNYTFFNPGLVLRKGWNITEFALFYESAIDDEIILSMVSLNDSKIVQLSKIKTNNKQLLIADSKYKVDSNKVVLFSIRSSKQGKGVVYPPCSMQIIVEI